MRGRERDRGRTGKWGEGGTEYERKGREESGGEGEGAAEISYCNVAHRARPVVCLGSSNSRVLYQTKPRASCLVRTMDKLFMADISFSVIASDVTMYIPMQMNMAFT